MKGRGSGIDHPNRFETIHIVPDPEAAESIDAGRPTVYLRDVSRSVLSCNDSPDVGFDVSINPYRGCEHGCAYCYARPTHEYLGFSAGLDFETRIMVKEHAPALLRNELSAPAWCPQPIALSGVTDPYQPVERRLRLTRQCLEVLAEFRNPVVIITKNELVTRDIDILGGLAEHDAVTVCVSITSLDSDLCGTLEPRTSRPNRRLEAVTALSKAGIPVGVMVAPIIPGLNDHEIFAIVRAAAGAGARFATHVVLRLPGAVQAIFDDWLTTHYPDRKGKVLNRIRSIRGGRLSDARFGSRMHGEGNFARQIEDLFDMACRQAGLERHSPELSIAGFRRPGTGTQTVLFEAT